MAVSSGRLVASEYFFEHAPDACCITDLEGHFVEVNSATERMLGYSRDEMFGEDFVSLGMVQAGAQTRRMADFRQNVEDGLWEKCQWIAKDGKPITVEVRWQRITRDGKSLVLGIAREVNNRKAGDAVSDRRNVADQEGEGTGQGSNQEESVQAELARLQAELDDIVRKRSEELSELNFQLNEEIRRHRQAKREFDTRQDGLRDALEAAHVGTFRLDAPSCNPLYWSDECYRILGVDPRETLPDRNGFLQNIIHPDNREESQRVVQRCADEGIPFDYEYQVVGKDGSSRWVSSKGVPIVQQGKIVGIQGTIQDVTERKSVEQTVWESEHRFRTIFDSEPQCVKLLDKEGRLIDMNSAGLAMVEADSLDDVRGECIYSVVVPEHRDRFIAANEESFSGKAATLQFEIIGLQGTRRWMDSQVVPLRGSDGTIIASLSVTREITEQRNTERQLHLTQFSVDTAVEGVFWIRPDDGRFMYVNESACSSLGYTREELLSLRVSDVDERVNQSDWPALAGHVRDQGTLSLESVHVRKDGATFPVEVNSTYLRADEAEFLCAQVRNISVRKQAEESIVESRRFIEAVAEASPYIIYVIDIESLDFTYFNRSLAAELGFDEAPYPLNVEEMIQLMPEEDHRHQASVIEQWRRMEEGEIREDEYHLVGADGSVRSFLSRETVFLGSPHSPVRQILGTAVDITDRKNSDEEKRRLQVQLQHTQKMEAIGQLASGVAHEFNNLLMAIRGNAELLLLSPNERLSEHVRVSLKEIERGCERASTLTQQLLSFARKKDSRSTVFDVNELVANIGPMLHRIIGREIELTLHLTQSELNVHADDSNLEQVLLNLVLNARDAMPTGGTLTIRTEVIHRDDPASGVDRPYARVSVIDNGCGMSQETRGRAFEPFFTTKPTGKGTGLGLSTVYSDIARANGFVSISSREGEGTSVDVHLPQTQKAVEVPEAFARDEIGGTETILVCDDEEIVRSAVSALLECVGYSVIGVGSAREALEKVEQLQGEISLLVTDVTMPEMDGFTLGRVLAERHADIKVIYTSGYTADRTIASDLGNVEFLTKGSSSRVILERVRKVLDEG